MCLLLCWWDRAESGLTTRGRRLRPDTRSGEAPRPLALVHDRFSERSQSLDLTAALPRLTILSIRSMKSVADGGSACDASAQSV
jgi:hypothetical protein